jgi:hypothetical protein
MDATKPFQAPFSRPVFLQTGYNNLLIVAHDHMGRATQTVDQYTDLPADFKREFTDGLAQFMGHEVRRRRFAAI